MSVSGRLRGDRGQAAVELVALLPLVVGGLLVCWQVVGAAEAAWSASAAARAAARARAIGADEEAAARAAVPARLEHGLRVHAGDGSEGRVAVSVRVPAVLPGIELGSLTASARASRRSGDR